MNLLNLLILFSLTALIKTSEIVCVYQNDDPRGAAPSYGFGCNVKTVILSPEDCYVKKVNSPSEHHTRDNLTELLRGEPEEPKTFDDVRFINFKSSKLKFIPRGLEKIFRNVIALIIDSPRLRTITGDDLRPFGSKLQSLIIPRSFIVSVNEDLFASTPNISHILIESEAMENVHENVFEPIKNSLRSLTVNFKCTGHRKEDEREEILELIKLMKLFCFHPKYNSAVIRTCNDARPTTARARRSAKGENVTYWITFCIVVTLFGRARLSVWP